MYSKVLVVLAAAALASANDLFIAATNNTEGHEKIFDQHVDAQWALTRQTKEVTVNASEGVICLVNVTDLRPNKDGEARITSGGIGQKNVTITLLSPAVFRGFDFRVQVYSHTHEDLELERNHRDVDMPEEVEINENKTAEPITEGTTEEPEVRVPELPTGNPVTMRPISGKPINVTTHKGADVPALEMGMHRVPKGAEQTMEM